MVSRTEKNDRCASQTVDCEPKLACCEGDGCRWARGFNNGGSKILEEEGEDKSGTNETAD